MDVTFNGHSLSQGCYVTEISRPWAGRSANLIDVPGMDGALFGGSKLEAGTISFKLVPCGHDRAWMRAKLREIVALLDVREPAPLVFSDDDDLYYMAVPDGKVTVAEYPSAFAIVCTFSVPDPALYGAIKTATIPSGGSATIEVGGTYAAHTIISSTGAVRGTSNLWGLKLDGGDFSRLKLPTAGATAISIDSATRTATIAGDAALMTLESDWLVLEPGEHTIANDVGTGASTITWTERWL